MEIGSSRRGPRSDREDDMEGMLRRAARDLRRPVLAMALVMAAMFAGVFTMSIVKERMLSSSVAERKEGAARKVPDHVIRHLVEEE